MKNCPKCGSKLNVSLTDHERKALPGEKSPTLPIIKWKTVEAECCSRKCSYTLEAELDNETIYEEGI